MRPQHQSFVFEDRNAVIARVSSPPAPPAARRLRPWSFPAMAPHPPASSSVMRLRSPPITPLPPMPLSGDTSLATIQSAPLRCSFALAVLDQLFGLGRKADDKFRPLRRVMADGSQGCPGFSDHRQRRRRPRRAVFFIFSRRPSPRASRRRPPRRSPTSAGSAASTASCICRAVSTCDRRHAGRVGDAKPGRRPA